MEKDEVIQEAVRIIRRYLPENRFKLMLFGSWAKDTAQPTSDIDIGILGDENIDEMLLLRIKEELKGIPTLRSIDIVDLGAADESFRKEVLSHAKPL